MNGSILSERVESVKIPNLADDIAYYSAEIERYTAEISGPIYSEKHCRRKIGQYERHVAALRRRAGAVGT